MLLKVALIVAVEFHINVEFVKLLEPPEDQEKGNQWPVRSSTQSFISYNVQFNFRFVVHTRPGVEYDGARW